MPRFTIDVDNAFNDTLDRLAQGGSKADVIRKAVATYEYLKNETSNQAANKRVSITDANGNVQKDVILP
jgi:predicted transcriptional regulator